MRDERRFADGDCAPRSECARSEYASENEPVCVGGGSGERERDVDRELCAECCGRTGMWMVRDSRRAASPWCVVSDATGGLPTAECLREIASGATGWRRMAAGLDDSVDPVCLDAVNDEHQRVHREGEGERVVRTLSAMPTPPVDLDLVAAVRARIVRLERRAEVGGLEGEGLVGAVGRGRDRLSIPAALLVAVAFAALFPLALSFAVPLLALELAPVLVLLELLLEVGGDRVRYALELLVAVLLGGLETAGDMAADERHGYGVCDGVSIR